MNRSNLIGVDVSDSSIKVLQLDARKNIVAYAAVSLPTGVVEHRRIVDAAAFSVHLQTALSQTKPVVLKQQNDTMLRAVLCLPESKLFSHHIVVPSTVKKQDEVAFIESEASKMIPFDLNGMYWDYHMVQDGKTKSATFVGVAKPDLDNYVDAFTAAHVRPAYIGGELMSLCNALIEESQQKEDYIIVDMGADSTTIGVFCGDSIPHASIIVPFGGDTLTQAIATKLNITVEEAEEKKRTHGMKQDGDQTAICAVLHESFASFIKALMQAQLYFEEKNQRPIRRIILSGGSALLPHIDTYVQTQTGVPTAVADPLIKIKNHEALQNDAPGILFGNVIGLALHKSSSRLSRINLLTQYRYEDSESEKQSLHISEIRSISDLYYVLYSIKEDVRVRISALHVIFSKFNIDLRLVASLVFLGITLVFLGWVVMMYM